MIVKRTYCTSRSRRRNISAASKLLRYRIRKKKAQITKKKQLNEISLRVTQLLNLVMLLPF
jgi:hypothetical protein